MCIYLFEKGIITTTKFRISTRYLIVQLVDLDVGDDNNDDDDNLPPINDNEQLPSDATNNMKEEYSNPGYSDDYICIITCVSLQRYSL